MIKIDATSYATLVHRYLAYCTFTKFSPKLSYRKVGKKYERYQKVEYKNKYYKIQWQNIKTDLLQPFRNAVLFAEYLGVPREFAYQLGAVAFDANSQKFTAATATSITNSHTCTGTNLAIVGFVFSANDAGKAMTYAAVDMGTAIGRGTSNFVNDIFAMGAPASGANNLVYSATNTQTNLTLIGNSFTGASQAANPTDGSTFGGANTSATDNITITTGTANSMLVDFCRTYDPSQVESISFSAGQSTALASTRRGTPTYDDASSYKLTTTAGAYTMGVISTKGSPWYWDHSGVGIKPVAAAATGNPAFLLNFM